MLGLGLQDAETQLVGRRMDIGDQSPAEARAHPLFHAFEIGRRLVGRDHDLPVLVDQRVEGMEELFLRRVLAANELDVVDHQHVDRAELLFERHRVLEAQGPDELVHELFGGKIDHLALRRVRADVPGDRMHQMRLAETDAAVEKQRIERHRTLQPTLRLGHTPRCGMRQLIRLADDEILEGKARIERRADVFFVARLGIRVSGGGGWRLDSRRKLRHAAGNQDIDGDDTVILSVP